MMRAARTAVTGLAAVLAPASVTLVGVRYAGMAPDPVPTHWNLKGQVNDTTPFVWLFVVCLVVSAVFAVLVGVALLRSRHQRADQLMAAASTWVAWLATTVFVVPVLASVGLDNAAAADISVLSVLAIPVVPTGAALLVAFLQKPAPGIEHRRSAPASRIRLDPHERVTWVGQSTSTGMLVVAAACLVVAVFLVFTVWPVANVLAMVAVLLFWMHVLTVRVDDRGVTVAWGPGRWPRIATPVAGLVSAHAEQIEPLSWGGWGYRRTLRGSAAVTRRGPGIVIERHGRKPLAVTVDDPADAVDLINAIVEREDRLLEA